MATTPVKVTALLALVLLLQNVHCESNTDSVVGMEFLLDIEDKLISVMEDYASDMGNKLSILIGSYFDMWDENLRSQADPEEYLANPINSFALMRRLHTDWKNWEQFLRRPVGENEIMKIEELRATIPTSVDLNQAFDEIYRLNHIHDLNPTDMALGLLSTTQQSARLTAIDCYSIGKLMLQNERYQFSEVWLNTSLQLYQDNDINPVLGFDKIRILELYAKVLLKQDRLSEALDAINLALLVAPDNNKLLQSKSAIEFMIKTSTEAVAM